MTNLVSFCASVKVSTLFVDEFESCGRDFVPLSAGHVVDVVEDILLDNGTMLRAGDRTIVTTICKEHVELKIGDNAVDVSRGWWHHLRG